MWEKRSPMNQRWIQMIIKIEIKLNSMSHKHIILTLLSNELTRENNCYSKLRWSNMMLSLWASRFKWAPHATLTGMRVISLTSILNWRTIKFNRVILWYWIRRSSRLKLCQVIRMIHVRVLIFKIWKSNQALLICNL